MNEKPKYYFDEALGIDYRDSGPWRSYYLYTSGNNLQELIENGTVSEIDQDGGELDCYGIDDGPNEVVKICYEIIENLIIKGNNNE